VIGRAAIAVLLVGAGGVSFAAAPVAAADCAASTAPQDLAAFFAANDAAGLAGADYPHVVDLPDGRTLWYFQDAFEGQDGSLRGDRFAHNAALVQDGACFERLPAPGGRGTSWIGSWVENDLQNWVWPLDAEVGADGHLWVFLAEVHNPNGRGAARGARPVGTWIARFTLPELQLVGMEEAPDPSHSLFGYSIVSDSRWTYLYGHCYRQFDGAETIGFDPDCSPHAYLARVPKGELGRELEYWSADGWTRDRSARTPVFTAEQSMPVSVERFGDTYVAVSDENDWFGSDVAVYTAPAPQGPWQEALRYTPDTKCGDDCNNYGAFVLPELHGDQVVIAHSNNAWDMDNAFDDASLYRISVRAVDVPGVSAASLARSPSLSLAEAGPDDAVAPVDTGADEPATEPDATDAVDDLVPAQTAPQPAAEPAASADTGGGVDAGAIATGVALVGAAALVLAASTGFARALAASRARRPAALARLRAVGATRRHG
jgi:hypothetical protein